jgi:hypothetical protein
MNGFRDLFFDSEGRPRFVVWTLIFLALVVPYELHKNAMEEEQRTKKAQAERWELGFKELREAQLLFSESRFLEASLKAGSSAQKLVDSEKRAEAERIRLNAKQKVLDTRKKLAPKLLRDAGETSKQRGFAGGGLARLRTLYATACQIPRDSHLFAQSLRLLESATKRAMKNTVAGDLRQRCEAVRDVTLDPSQL